MRVTLIVHVLAGALGLASGYVALAASKGAPLHRKAGMVFVYVMVTMSVTGMLIAAVQGVAPAINVPTALLTIYLVTTALTTVKPPVEWSRSLDVASMLAAFAVGVSCIALAFAAIAKGGRDVGFAYPLFLFAAIGLAAGAGDRRVLRRGRLRGGPRLRRHLWRMCFGLFIASIAFYLGPDRLPEALRSPVFRAAGLLTPLVAMTYWLWRIRARRPIPSIVTLNLNPQEQPS